MFLREGVYDSTWYWGRILEFWESFFTITLLNTWPSPGHEINPIDFRDGEITSRLLDTFLQIFLKDYAI